VVGGAEGFGSHSLIAIALDAAESLSQLIDIASDGEIAVRFL